MGAAATFDVKSVEGDSRDLSKQDQSLVAEVAVLKSQLFRYENIKVYLEQLSYLTGLSLAYWSRLWKSLKVSEVDVFSVQASRTSRRLVAGMAVAENLQSRQKISY